MGDTKVREYPFCMKNYTPILPLVYSDALSYLETLGQFANKLNEVVDRINNVTTEAVEMANQYTDEKIAQQTSIIEQAVADVNTAINQIRTENARFVTTVNSRMGIVEYNFERLKEKTDADYKASVNYTNLAIQSNNDYLIDNMQKELSKVKVLNYFTGAYISIQDMFDYLAQFHLSNAISVDTLVARRKTVNQLIAYNMTLTDLATNGASIIVA